MKPLLPVVLAAALLTTATTATAAYVNSEYGFSATAPKGWKQLAYPGAIVVFAGAASGGFATNINVTSEKLHAGISLARYEAAGRENLKKAITDFKFLGRRSITLGGQPAFEQSFTGRQGQFDLYFTQAIAISGGRGFIVTGTSIDKLRSTLIPAMAGFEKTFAFKK